MISLGARAPEFSLKDQHGTMHHARDLRGKYVVLSFHPLAWTGVCQRQMESLDMNADAFRESNAIAFGVSVDAPPSKKAWADSMNIRETLLLSDFWPHGGVAQALGIFKQDAGTSERANIIIDPKGIVRWVKVYPVGEVPNIDEVLRVLRKLNAHPESN